MSIDESAYQLVLERWVRDVEVSARFYESIGFSIERMEEGFAVLSWNREQILMLGEVVDPVTPHPLSGHIRVLVPDVDATLSIVEKLGREIYRDIADQLYGLREFMILDPDGFGIRFATPTTKVSART